MKFTLILFLMVLSAFVRGQGVAIRQLSMEKLSEDPEAPLSTISLYIEQDSNKVYHHIFRKYSALEGGDEQFRIASTTKMFVSVVILQLMEEGKLDLDSKALALLDNVGPVDSLLILENRDLTPDITVRHLLSHRSGFADIYSDKENEFFEMLLSDPERQYNPLGIIQIFRDFGLDSLSYGSPGEVWNYSDMNYVLLGLIIESLDNRSLHKSIRTRILGPLGMNLTYFEFYEENRGSPERIHQFIYDVDFTALNTSFDWGGGGLVSTHSNLSKFMKGLFAGELITPESLSMMIDVEPTMEHESSYGLGINKSHYDGKVFYGHYGYYGTYLGYSPEADMVLSYCISQAYPGFNVNQYINEIIRLISQ